jgi:hypothetical protein
MKSLRCRAERLANRLLRTAGASSDGMTGAIEDSEVYPAIAVCSDLGDSRYWAAKSRCAVRHWDTKYGTNH